MKNYPRILLMVAAIGMACCANSVSAATECNGPLSGTVADGVVVNAGDFCMLGGANVSGGVRVNSGGKLIMCGSFINDGIVSNGAVGLIIGAEELPGCTGNSVNGGVQISNTGGGFIPAPAPSIALENNLIHGAVQLSGNQGRIVVATNIISGGLFCRNNAHDLGDEGSPNVITGAVRCTFGEEE